jgi:hypothetical protein
MAFGYILNSFEIIADNKEINGLLKMKGRRVAESIIHDEKKYSHWLAPIIQTQLVCFSEEVIEKFNDFVEHLIEINRKVDVQTRIDISNFFPLHAYKIIQLVNIMGIEAIRLMKNKVSSIGSLGLNGLMDDMPELSQELRALLNEYFVSLRITVNQDPEKIDCFFESLICLGVLENMARAQKDFDWLCSESMKNYFRNIMIVQETQNFKNQNEFLRAIISVLVEKNCHGLILIEILLRISKKLSSSLLTLIDEQILVIEQMFLYFYQLILIK